MLEREAELSAVAGSLADCRAGHGHTVLVTASAGMGKTALLDLSAEWAADEGFQVLRACGGQFEENIPFGVVRQLFGSLLAEESEEFRKEVLSGAAGFAPRALGVVGEEDSPSVARAEAPFAVLHGLYWLVANLAGRGPMVIVLDDLHWVDLPSMRWLVHLARRLEGLPVLVLASLRTDVEPTAELLLGELRSASPCRVLELAGLSRAAVTRVAADVLGTTPHGAFADACLEVSDGNPLVLHGMLGSLVHRSVPPDVDQVETARGLGSRVYCDWVVDVLAGQSEDVVRFGRALAVLSGEVDIPVAAEVASLSTPTSARAAAALERAGILVPGTLRFQHPLVRMTIADAMSAPERARTHQRAARVLGDGGAPLDHVASHLLSAGPPSGVEVVHVLRDAAVMATDRGAPEPAVAYLRHALDGEWSSDLRVTLLTELSIAERAVDPLAAKKHVMEALRLIDSPRARANAVVTLSPLLAASGTVTLVTMLQECLRDLPLEAPGSDPELEELRTRIEAHMIYAAAEDYAVMEPMWERLARLDQNSLGGTPGQCALLAIHVFLSSAAVDQDVESAVESASRSLQANLLLNDELLHPMFMGAMGALQMTENFDLVARSFEAGIDNARARNWPMAHAILSGARSLLMFRRGMVEESVADARAALDMLTPEVWGEAQPMLCASAASGLVELGEPEEAAALVLRDFPPESERSYRWCWLLDARAKVREAQGDLRAALADALECGRRLSWWRIRNPAVVPWRERAALLHHRLGNPDEARRLAEESLGVAKEWGTDGHLGAALRVVGVIEGGDKGIEHLRSAVSHGERSPAVLELARSLVEFGTALHARGEWAPARKTLRRGLDLATERGAAVLASRARAELVAAGGRPRRNRQHGFNALTPAERQVVDLAAHGRSNGDIAQTLFVTQRTVEFHLTNSYRKLGLSDRSRLAEFVTAS